MLLPPTKESFAASRKDLTGRQITVPRDLADEMSESNLVRADVFDYIERFYNSTRRHST